MEEDSPRVRLRLHRQTHLIGCCKRFVAFLFSHVGLAAMVVAYSILGGFLFVFIESSNAIELKRDFEVQLEKIKNDTIARILNELLTADTCDQLKSSRWNATGEESVRKNLNLFQEGVFERLAMRRKGLTEQPKGSTVRLIDDDDQWSFSASLLFAVTVITTIGKCVTI